MKAKELMINDWIAIDEPDRYAGATGQIKSLQYHQEDDASYFQVFIQGKFGYLTKDVCGDDVKPIPLTAEFFDRNGWHCIESEKYGKRYGLYDDYYEMTAHEFNDGMWRVEYDCIEMGGIPIECVNIGWVHELQHFLSHCAVEMEIKLED